MLFKTVLDLKPSLSVILVFLLYHVTEIYSDSSNSNELGIIRRSFECITFLYSVMCFVFCYHNWSYCNQESLKNIFKNILLSYSFLFWFEMQVGRHTHKLASSLSYLEMEHWRQGRRLKDSSQMLSSQPAPFHEKLIQEAFFCGYKAGFIATTHYLTLLLRPRRTTLWMRSQNFPTTSLTWMILLSY